jgi:hypothetical protein
MRLPGARVDKPCGGADRSGAARVSGVFVTVVLASCWAIASGIDRRYVIMSDGVYTYTASLIAELGPGVLYEHVVVALPPLVLLLAGAAWWAWPAIESVRMLLAALDVVTALLVWGLARQIGVRGGWAVAAGVLAVTMPLANQYRGLDGEVLLAPLSVAAAWACVAGRGRLVAAFAATGLLVKLTWVLILPALAWNVLRQAGLRAAIRTMLGAVVLAALAWVLLAFAAGWSATELRAQLFVAQSGSGIDPSRLGPRAWTLAGMWWPFLLLAAAATNGRVPRPVWACLLATTTAIGFTVKSGTTLNVVAPAEPLLALVAVVGLQRLAESAVRGYGWRTWGARVGVIGTVVVVGLRAVTIIDDDAALRLPHPLGASVMAVGTEQAVEAHARLVAESAGVGTQVIADPHVALVAGRAIALDQPDWFLLHALERACDARSTAPSRHCGAWQQVLQCAEGLDVIHLSFNVSMFDETAHARMVEAFPVTVDRVGKRPFIARVRARDADAPARAPDRPRCANTR